MPKLKICIVTGSRADYGLLFWILKDLQEDTAIHLQLAVTGMHLSAEFGNTARFIEEDGFVADETIETLLSADSPSATAKAIGLGVIGFADAFQRLDPHVVLVLGDRYEIFAAVQAAFIQGRTIAHIGGGDITEGALDESLRHGITKMSHLHFVTNAESARRVRQLGEDPGTIFLVGSPGLDYITRSQMLSREQLEARLQFALARKNFLITFHPATLEADTAAQCSELLAALEETPAKDLRLIFTLPNADTGGRRIIQLIEKFVAEKPHASAFASLGHLYYLSLVAQVDVVIGNSSSGVYEVPSFKKPTIDIGDRQKGRLFAESVVHCDPNRSAIKNAIKDALAKDCSRVVNPYGEGDSSRRIGALLKALPRRHDPIKKRFFDI